MAKLKCLSHNRRVVASDGQFIHRTGDGSRCDSPVATMTMGYGRTKFRPAEVVERGPRAERTNLVEDELGVIRIDLPDVPAERLLHEIFGSDVPDRPKNYQW